MPTDPRAVLKDMLANPKLDELLESARKQAAALAPESVEQPSAAEQESYFEQSISKVSAGAADAAAALREAAEQKRAERAEKVAIAKHLVEVSARLLEPVDA
jgi:hypothetical protein